MNNTFKRIINYCLTNQLLQYYTNLVLLTRGPRPGEELKL